MLRIQIKCSPEILPYFLIFLGNQANSFDRIIRSWENIYKGGGWGHGIN